MRIFSIYIFIVLSITSCKKEEQKSVIPEIEFSSISSNEVLQFDNNVQITFKYKDGNGDLGHEDPDVLQLKVKDSRLSEWDWFHIPPVTPNDMELDVEGSFTVELAPLFLLGSGALEDTFFTLQLRDREGNWSNQIVTPEVLIRDSL